MRREPRKTRIRVVSLKMSRCFSLLSDVAFRDCFDIFSRGVGIHPECSAGCPAYSRGLKNFECITYVLFSLRFVLKLPCGRMLQD